MPIAGRAIQFNIGSILSVQLKAGFIAARQNSQWKPEPQTELWQERAAGQLKKNGADAEQRGQWDFYEVVGPYADGASSIQQEAVAATITALPAHVDGKAVPISTEAPSSNYGTIKAYSASANMRQEPINGQNGYLHSYNQNGQRVFMTIETNTVDFFM